MNDVLLFSKEKRFHFPNSLVFIIAQISQISVFFKATLLLTKLFCLHLAVLYLKTRPKIRISEPRETISKNYFFNCWWHFSVIWCMFDGIFDDDPQSSSNPKITFSFLDLFGSWATREDTSDFGDFIILAIWETYDFSRGWCFWSEVV